MRRTCGPTVSLAERLAGPSLRRTPLVLDDYVALVDPLLSTTELCGRVEAVQPEVAGAVTLRIRPSPAWRGHLAGQYVRVGVDLDGVRRWRTLLVTCPPDLVDGCLTITGKAIDGGLVSGHLTSAVPVGTVVQLGAAEGEFVLPDQVPERLLLLTAGSSRPCGEPVASAEGDCTRPGARTANLTGSRRPSVRARDASTNGRGPARVAPECPGRQAHAC